MLKIAFRADGGRRIGMGHLMRCLALASAFPDDIEVSFITRSDKEGVGIIEGRGYNVINFYTNLLEEELNLVKEIVEENDIDIIITDSYQLDYDYLLSLKKVVKRMISIHDFAPFPFPSDIVINGNIYARDLDYQSTAGNSKFLLGTEYLLMRDEFMNLPERVLNNEVKKILITAGGGDPLNLTPEIIAGINRLEENDFIKRDDLHLDIVIGPVFNNTVEIIKILREINIEVSLHYNIKKMSELMLNCDLAVSAGGSTLYELAAAGIPVIAILQADNQLQGVEYMEERGIIINLGMGDQVKTDKITVRLAELIGDFELRKRMSRRGQKLVDGRGAGRCVEIILSNYKGKSQD